MKDESGRSRGAKSVRPKGVIIVAANSAWALSNYRLGLLNALRDYGFDVVALVPDPEAAERLKAEAIQVWPVPMAPHGTSPLGELRLLYRYVRILRELRPAGFLGFTIKPNIYGALAGRLARVPVINNVTGLGLVFASGRPLRFAVTRLYRFALRTSHIVFFQNRESRDLFLSLGLVGANQAALLPGSGIDLKHFALAARQQERPKGEFTFLLASRLMWQKGIAEYCEAAARIRVTHPNIRFQLLGPVEPESNKAAIPRRQVEQWAHEAIDYLGAAEDVRPFLEAADCVVLPSYYPEGVPRILIEAAAMGKPNITTDTPGCRDVVEPGATGYLCEPGSVGSLVAAMLEMVAQSPEDRAEMARRARSKMEREFDERIVIDAYLAALNSIPSS